MEAVVKVFCTHSEPNFSLPWQRKRQFSSSGSGFAISGRRLLTNAHCVDHATQVRVKRRGSDTKYLAQVLAIGQECDVALLSVEDESFWRGLSPIEFGSLPSLQDDVAVVGYPIGGDTMSITSGVISRIEVTSYVHGGSELLGVQIDAAINAGNSGGPAFGDSGECVGIAFQSLKHEDAENISYIIPMPVVEHFIRDYESNGRYTGFPSLGVEWQKMESPVLRKALGMAPDQSGVLVRRVEPTAPASAVLAQGDVLLAFDDVDIGKDGTVPFRSGERIGFSYLVSQKFTGNTAKLKILKAPKEDQGGEEKKDGRGNEVHGGKKSVDGEGGDARGGAARGEGEGASPASLLPSSSPSRLPRVVEASVVLRPSHRLIPVHIDNRPPSYYIVGGLVFTPVTVPLLRSEYGKEFDYDAPVKLLDKMMHAMAETADQQIVVLSQVLVADANVGYEDVVNTQVVRVNGQKATNLRDLVRIVESTTSDYLRFDLEYNQVIVLDKKSAAAATQEILEQHCIAHDRSPDLLRENATDTHQQHEQKRTHAHAHKGQNANKRTKAKGAKTNDGDLENGEGAAGSVAAPAAAASAPAETTKPKGKKRSKKD